VKRLLAAALVGLTLIVLLVQDIPLAGYLRTVETDRIYTALERDAFLLSDKALDTLNDPTPDHLDVLQTALDRYEILKGARVVVVDVNGIVVADTQLPTKAGSNYLNRPEIQKALTGQVDSGRRYSSTSQSELLYVAVPIYFGSDLLGAIRITYPAAQVDGTVSQRIFGLAIVAGITLLIAILVAVLLANAISRRIKDLEVVTDEFTKGNLSVRANEDEGAHEIRMLARSFNEMSDSLSRLLSSQRAFAADASHQLRTPLTALQLRLERASELVNSDPAGAAERIDAATEEAQRLQRLVEGLLALSRADAQDHPALTVVDLCELVRERAESWEALADDRGITIKASQAKGYRVSAMDHAVEQVIDNYIDNALAIAPDNSTITLEVTRGPRYTTLHVLDEGPGMPAADLEKAFNRFWRARSDKEGSGLGLAIVERLVTVGGGNVRLANRVGTGLDAQADFLNA